MRRCIAVPLAVCILAHNATGAIFERQKFEKPLCDSCARAFAPAMSAALSVVSELNTLANDKDSLPLLIAELPALTRFLDSAEADVVFVALEVLQKIATCAAVCCGCAHSCAVATSRQSGRALCARVRACVVHLCVCVCALRGVFLKPAVGRRRNRSVCAGAACLHCVVPRVHHNVDMVALHVLAFERVALAVAVRNPRRACFELAAGF